MESSPTVPWWRSGVVYQIYPRSFADSSGDGVGDLEGIRQRLDHLAWLGVDALWLSPIYPSPMADFGYDVAHYCDIHPVFGDLATFDRLVADAHARGIRVLLDWVPNHTSSEHPWFVESRSSRTAPRRDWYIWRDGRDGGPPNNWLAAFGVGSAWTHDAATDQWYLHLFLPEQPDLNWANPDVEAAMHDVLRFWLDRGVDGFRADVVHLIGKDPALPDQPPELARRDLVGVHDYDGTHELLRRIRRVLDDYDGDRMMVGEVNLASAALVAPYCGEGDELHLAFNFRLIATHWDAGPWKETIDDAEEAFGTRDAWPTWVLSNHDVPRHRSRLGGREDRARATAVGLLALRGTPFLYAGEELGLDDAEIPVDRQVDPGGRDPCRAPLPWTRAERHGWAGDPWLPWPPEPAVRSAEAQRDDPASILHLYRRVLTARRASPALSTGAFAWLPAPGHTLAWERVAGDDRRVVAMNFSDETVALDLADADLEVVVHSNGVGEGQRWSGRLEGASAVILQPRG